MNKAQEAILRIMAKTKSIGNDIKIEGSTVKYNCLSESAVLAVLRPLFIEEGLIYYPIDGNLTISGAVTLISAHLKVVHVESGDSIEIYSAGAGKDSQDKGPGKALTYMTKYGLLKLLMLRGEDDPDQFGSEDLTKRDQEIKFARDKAVEIADEILKAGTIGKPEYNMIVDNINDAVNDRNAQDRLAKAIAWLEKVKTLEITYKVEVDPQEGE